MGNKPPPWVQALKAASPSEYRKLEKYLAQLARTAEKLRRV